ncbi:PREDICTED: DPY30 domain-containing protein 2 [Bison bison bison]|uniref:DPY30 domain-containing protein 2 n=1 Tax=Bison bison bison TaxID=43346 RepID=A0A6P3GLM5_BISBB|nr:PREDICTED: DPY30 domain-containing protein 2 [Bison bison bison]XP_010832449.1 PREDICTED: DPY30 domain-containing protein 2 [Bison bison bison]XP_010832450.1 PREDICTED: DPY30 domain-containing protein 2 [Bison bison bison]XP_010832451.1 PREDICTED: DPY30 domain-containing protein 2 [Bison bison bison]
METNYLKRCFGNRLAQALAEVAMVQPSDPIEYLAHWLYHYRKTVKAKEKDRQEKIQLQREYENSLKETRMAEMLKQEERAIQEQCEKCHHQLERRNSTVGTHPHPVPLISVASSLEKTKFMQENTEAFEKEPLKQESLPGTSDMIPGMPQHSPSSEPSVSSQVDLNTGTPQEINYQAIQHEIALEIHPGSESPP